MSSQKSYDLIGCTAPDPSKLQLQVDLLGLLQSLPQGCMPAELERSWMGMYALIHVIYVYIRIYIYGKLKRNVYILDFLEAAITAYDDIWNTKKLNCLN